jgi:hypothetical protein
MGDMVGVTGLAGQLRDKIAEFGMGNQYRDHHPSAFILPQRMRPGDNISELWRNRWNATDHAGTQTWAAD